MGIMEGEPWSHTGLGFPAQCPLLQLPQLQLVIPLDSEGKSLVSLLTLFLAHLGGWAALVSQ